MALRVAINGFGRIGRCVARIAHSRPDIELVHINDLTSPEQLAHLLAWDTVHGHWNVPVSVKDGHIVTGDRSIRITAEPDPSKLPWIDQGIDVVLECTGLFTKAEKARKHMDAGAGRVVISARVSASAVVTSTSPTRMEPATRAVGGSRPVMAR